MGLNHDKSRLWFQETWQSWCKSFFSNLLPIKYTVLFIAVLFNMIYGFILILPLRTFFGFTLHGRRFKASGLFHKNTFLLYLIVITYFYVKIGRAKLSILKWSHQYLYRFDHLLLWPGIFCNSDQSSNKF